MSDAQIIDTAKRLALLVLSEMEQDEAALRRRAVEEVRWFSFAEIKEITGLGETKLRQLVQQKKIPMFRLPGTNEWRITKKAWQACEARLIDEGMQMRVREMAPKSKAA